MKPKLSAFVKCLATGSLLMGALSTLAQQLPTIITTTTPNGMEPNGIEATTNELLFSQPFCDGPGEQPRGIYLASNFVTVGPNLLDATMTNVFPLTAMPACGVPLPQGAENYFVISPGLGGFPLDSVYITLPNGSGATAIDQGSAVFVPSVPDPTPGHAGITFDTVGTFNNVLFVTTGAGIFGYNSAGNLVVTYPAPVSGALFESATVAPLTNTACPGCLYITSKVGLGPGPGALYTVPAFSGDGTHPTFLTLVPGTEPEGIQFITPQACTLNNTDFSYFVSGYAHGSQTDSDSANNGALLAYTQTQLQPYVGLALIPTEEEGTIWAFNPATKVFTPFSTPTAPGSTDLYQLEGNTLAACAPVPSTAKGRMTGGGSFFTPDGTRVTHGLELHCSVPSHPNTLEINWATGNNFHLDTLTSVACFEDPAFNQGQPHADFNTMVGTGTGTLNGAPATISFEFTDAGEPGTSDEASVTIISGATTFTVPLTVLDSGNQQAHK